jgi:hypothetical protein
VKVQKYRVRTVEEMNRLTEFIKQNAALTFGPITGKGKDGWIVTIKIDDGYLATVNRMLARDGFQVVQQRGA